MADHYHHYHCYIAISPCGCITGAAVDDGGDWVGDSVSEFIKSGRAVERVRLREGQVPNMTPPRKCPHGARQLTMEGMEGAE